MELKKLKKIGGGQLHLKDGRTIKSGETFFAYLETIPFVFRDTVKEYVARKRTDIKSVVIKPIIPRAKYAIQQRRKTVWYDVVNAKGKIVSKKAMHKQEALDFIKTI